MRFASFVSLAAFFVAASAASTSNLERRITDPGNPANLDNCPPNGGADACNLEQPCSRIRLNYGSTQGGHYIWYNYDITDIPPGIQVGTEISCTDY
ncbi:hypothetical protein EV361DRAFT_801625 [Lentinula raphanica]|uniref:Uncharacterized protein n=1 Tax=Lentinula raphanica TaxID=153919 RepID=A0AA38PF98_9AGAR|nr:hypothetical protein F5880DRAFT_1487591 [Lentinula raphanica]KAJ3841588.1 hypothetical protein F5878DRAFT_4960 [Lentinula raphanica]KAJ3970672.1 hypothetical protein EV361DRAFT_801625 [Lentinula raphanica]